jgi:hypothetical protein
LIYFEKAELIEYINPPQVLSLNEMEANKMLFFSKAAIKKPSMLLIYPLKLSRNGAAFSV